MARPGVQIYFDLIDALTLLTDADRGRLFLDILLYGRDGVEPEYDGMMQFVWAIIKPKVDADGAHYEEVVDQKRYAAHCRNMGDAKPSYAQWLEQNGRQRPLTDATAANGRQRTQPTTTQINNNSVQHRARATQAALPPEPAPFVPPSEKEVSAYCLRQGLNVDAQRFIDYYKANGWRVGQNPMVDWQAVCRRWASRDEQGTMSATEDFPDGCPWEVV